MAKKTTKKAAKKSTKTSSKATAKKPSPAGPGGKGSFRVTTGSGATPMDIGTKLVSMFNTGQFNEIEKMFWSPKIESIEGLGVGMGWRGKPAVDAKNAGWMAQNKIHGASAEGPFVGSSGFAVRFKMDVEQVDTGTRTMFDEVGVYTVKNGKIIREEFMYSAM